MRASPPSLSLSTRWLLLSGFCLFASCRTVGPEYKKPAITAVKMPASGLTPEAIANAIASGKATIPTVIPAVRSVINAAAE